MVRTQTMISFTPSAQEISSMEKVHILACKSGHLRLEKRDHHLLYKHSQGQLKRRIYIRLGEPTTPSEERAQIHA